MHNDREIFFSAGGTPCFGLNYFYTLLMIYDWFVFKFGFTERVTLYPPSKILHWRVILRGNILKKFSCNFAEIFKKFCVLLLSFYSYLLWLFFVFEVLNKKYCDKRGPSSF